MDKKQLLIISVPLAIVVILIIIYFVPILPCNSPIITAWYRRDFEKVDEIGPIQWAKHKCSCPTGQVPVANPINGVWCTNPEIIGKFYLEDNDTWVDECPPGYETLWVTDLEIAGRCEKE